MAADSAALKKAAVDAIDAAASDLHELSKEIWSHPELCFEEKYAHDYLTDFLEKRGFPIERKYVLDTAFRSVYGSGDGPQVAVLAEYDALPEIGHACGHNLIAEVGIGAAIGIKAALDKAGGNLGKLITFGTPAEESGGGKVDILRAGGFANLDLSFMSHPWPSSILTPNVIAIDRVKVRYHGKASHAAGFPWEGVNALDAAVMAYSSISCMRQQMKPSWRIHGVITNGGAKPNIIPEEAALEYYVRAPTMAEVNILKEKVTACFEAAAKATGCTVDLEWHPKPYYNMISNPSLVSLYEDNAVSVGVKFDTDREKLDGPSGSTDMGNVSHVVPSIHPMFYIGSDEVNHTRGFTGAAGDPKAQSYTLQQAKALAMTAVDVYCQPQLVDKMKQQLQEELQRQAGQK